MPNPASIKTAALGITLLVMLSLSSLSDVLAQEDMPPSYDPQTVRVPGESDGDVYKMSLQEAVALTLNNSRELDLRMTKAEIERHKLRSAGGVNNPEFRISRVSTRYIADEFDELELGLRWQPPRIGELGEQKNDQNVLMWEIKVDAERYRSELAALVMQTYADVVVYDQMVEVASNRLKLEKKRLAQVEQMKELGRRSIVYYTKASLRHETSKSDYARAVQRRNTARRELSRLTGVDEAIAVEDVEPPDIKHSLDDLLRIAEKNRPEMKLIAPRLELAKSRYDEERFKLIPWFSYFELSYHEEERNIDWGEFMVGIELPLFNWNIGNIKATSKALDRKEQQSAATRELIENEVRAAYGTYHEALLDWRLSSRDVEKMVNATQELIDEAARHNTLKIDEIMELELSVEETKELLLEKKQTLAYALYDLYFALGIENHSELDSNGQ